MALSSSAIHNIADAMKDEAINFIEADERYADFMIEMLTEFASMKLGSNDPELVCEVSCCMMDRIQFKSVPI